MLRHLYSGLALLLGLVAAPSRSVAEVEIQLWSGDHQTVGAPHLPQRWFNLMGEVGGHEEVQSLTASLNGGPERVLSLGKGSPRLIGKTHFNLDLLVAELQPGPNTIVIRAHLKDGGVAERSAIVERVPSDTSAVTSLGYDWRGADTIPGEVLLIDGHWTPGEHGLRPTELGYDRVFAVGDRWWSDYEVTVPVVIHGAKPYHPHPTHAPAFFVGTRWQGHRQWFAEQPAMGWWPNGGMVEGHWFSDEEIKLQFVGNKVQPLGVPAAPISLEFDRPYLAKVRVETVPRHGSLYSAKFWPADEPEPEHWQVRGAERLWDPLFGSVLFVAHHSDISFGGMEMLALTTTPWSLLENFGGLAVQAPILLVGLVGLFVAYRLRPTSAKRARAIAAASILAILATLLGVVADFQLPLALHRAEWGTHEIAIALLAKDAIKGCLWAISLAILLFLGGRKSDVS